MNYRHIRKYNLIIPLCIGIVLLVLILRGFKHPEKHSASEYSIRITMLRGTEDTPSLITLRLFNRRLQQMYLERTKQTDQLLTFRKIRLGPSFWKSRVRFYCMDAKGEEKDITDLVSLKKHPEKKHLFFSPDTVYSAYYTVELSDLPQDGSKIYALARIGGGGVKSNYILVSYDETKPDFAKAANILYRLGDYESLISASQELIRKEPDSPAGYWFCGLAYEKMDKYGKALEYYLAANERIDLKKLLAETQELPTLLWQKIQHAKRKLNLEQDN